MSQRPVSNTAEHNWQLVVVQTWVMPLITIAFMGHAGAEGAELVELVGARLGTLLAGRAPAHRLVHHHRAAAALRLGHRRRARVQALAVPEQGETVVPPRVCQHGQAYITPGAEGHWGVSGGGVRRPEAPLQKHPQRHVTQLSDWRTHTLGAMTKLELGNSQAKTGPCSIPLTCPYSKQVTKVPQNREHQVNPKVNKI